MEDADGDALGRLEIMVTWKLTEGVVGLLGIFSLAGRKVDKTDTALFVGKLTACQMRRL